MGGVVARMAAGALLVVMLGAADAPSPAETAADAILITGLRALGLTNRADVMLNRTSGGRVLASDTLAFYHHGDGWVATLVQETHAGASAYGRQPDLWAASTGCGAIQEQLAALDKLPTPRFSTSKFQVRDLSSVRQNAAGQTGDRATLMLVEGPPSYRLDAPTDRGERIEEQIGWQDPDPAVIAWIEQTLAAVRPCMTTSPPAS
ncbi:MAG: hypothetical protein JWM33_3463 [Caulobacteraceae bacterium]|nr:hypothetical protein [Caulobacteraceae bacterium]